jgi:hypothetical protein
VAEEFRQRSQHTVRKARGRNSLPVLSHSQFFEVLGEHLGARQLTAAEAKWAEDFYHRNAPLIEKVVRAALQGAVEAKGTSRHIRYYLDRVQAARLEEGGGQ